MAWSAPITAVANAIFTAAQFNATVRDNLNETAPAKATAAGQIFVATGANAIAARTITGARVDTSETTASTAYTALTTPGPAVTATTGTQALVMLKAAISNNTAGSSSFMGVAVSGATTTAATDSDCLRIQGGGTTDVMCATTVLLLPLTAGSNTFTAQYRAGANTATFSVRTMIVVPL